MMGNFYTNVTLYGPSQTEILDDLRNHRLNAYVSPTVGRFTVIYEQKCDTQEQGIMKRMASALSRRFECPLLAVLNHNDNVLSYCLYVNGTRIDHYDSAPGSFLGLALAPSGGNAQILCETFGVPEKIDLVHKILHPRNHDHYLFAVDRHADLIAALGLPTFSVGLGFNGIERYAALPATGQREEICEGLKRQDLAYTG
jgi:hypothetical protein